MATTYRTSQGDVLDLVCKQYYGNESAVSQVMAANPNLSEYGSVLPSNIEIILPDIQTKTTETVSLWD